MLYISSALSLYFPWDFCLYEGMTALASNFFAYIPFIVAMIIITVVLKYRYCIDASPTVYVEIFEYLVFLWKAGFFRYLLSR